MSRWPAFERFLETNPRDVGCDEADVAVLHTYAEARRARVRIPKESIRASAPICAPVDRVPRTWTASWTPSGTTCQSDALRRDIRSARSAAPARAP